MIEFQDLRKSYDDVAALRGISASIESGQIVGLLGPNGAGKSTAMRILVGYLLPTSGTARVAGIDVTEDPLAVQQRIGYLPESAPLYTEMLVQEYLQFIANRRLSQLGLPEQFPNAQNPFPWMSEIMDLRKEKNFFETRVIEYQTGGALTWD